MRTHTLRWAIVLSVLAATVLIIPQRVAADDEDDPPSRVARLSYTRGAVSFSPAGTDEWVSAVANRPVTTGDKLWTDRNARAELSLGTAYIRLGEETGFSFLNLDDRTTQIRLTEGTINLRVRRLDEDEILEVDTPNLAFSVLRPGSYKLNVNENGDATIIEVRGGEGEVTGAGTAYRIRSGEIGTFTGIDQIRADVDILKGEDDFDEWCADRDRHHDRSLSVRYVSDDVIGYEDLDDYGGWRPVPDYGYVWFPHTTIVGWAPYRYGHWVWISPWGWTWVDDAPWGFAPFHYGRWVFVGGIWGWVPCPPRPRVVTAVYVRPVYAPALVAWVGGAHWGVSVAVGGGPAGVAWFPLGPRDVYCPSYHVSRTYVENVNISNTTIINRTYVTNVYNNVYVNKSVNVTNIRYQNQRESDAVTATSRTVFTSAQPVGRNVIRVNEREVASAPVAPLTPAVVPEHRSVVGAGAEAREHPPASVVSRPVTVKTAPPPAPVPFIRQRQAVESNEGRPLSTTQERQMSREGGEARRNIRMAPPTTVRPAQPVQPAPEPRAVQPVQPPQRPPVRTERPVPPQPQPGAVSRQEARPDSVDRRRFEDRPPTSRPGGPPPVNPQLEQRQQQQMEKLRQQQDAERQRVEQRQIQEQQKLQRQAADQQREQMIRQRQQQQLEQMERKHEQQTQKLEQRQQKEVQKEQKQERKQEQKQEQKRERPSQPKPPNF